VDELLAPLNEAQRQAVLHGDGPLLVLAGAGSGKTRVIVHRIAHLVRQREVPPWRILAVTFTNKAAGEMRERLERLLGADAAELWVMTFHAFGARFLRREAAAAKLPPQFAIYDDSDQVTLAKRLLREAKLGDRFSPRDLLSRIDRWKNQGLTPERVKPDGYDVEGEVIRGLYRRYEDALSRAGAVDFGDLLLLPLELLESNPEVAQAWGRRFRYVLVDEFQDTSPVQYRLLGRLSPAGPVRNVCVVGDDDQSIYRWRGADVKNILDFESDFPGTMVVKLEQNYRSTSRILEAAHAVISKAHRRREKRLWTERSAGDPLQLQVAPDEHAEARLVAQAIQEERRRGTAPDGIAVLYRMNAQSRVIEFELRSAGIPYVIVRGRSFYERAEIKDAASYLRLALSPDSDLDLERVINRPARGIGDTTLERVRAYAATKGVSLFAAISGAGAIPGINAAAERRLTGFHAIITGLAAKVGHWDAGGAVQEMLRRSELIESLRKEGTEEAVERAENLMELLAAAREFDEAHADEPAPRDPDEPRPAPLARFLEQIALMGDADAATPEGKVALMTLHAAKGLEFDAVVMAGMEEGTLPHARWGNQEADDVDEERRLCYVGMTRARQRLTLTLARRRMGFGEGGPSYRSMEPSRFLGDLRPELFGIQPGERPVAAAAPRVRRHPGALPDEPVIELDDAPPPDVPDRLDLDFQFDQRPAGEGARAFAAGARVRHSQFGEGIVRGCEGTGPDAKVTVAFFSIGQKRVVARWLKRV
jgi:DNA helicase-2/ATP-dependent DNA helicase PcrA